MTERTPYGMIAAFDVVTDDLALLMRDLTARVAELTQGWPDRLDDLTNAALPPSDTGELGYDRRDDGRLTHHDRLRRRAVRRPLRPGRPEAARAEEDALVPGRQPGPGAHPRRHRDPGPVRPRDGHPPRDAGHHAPHQGTAGGALVPAVLPAHRPEQGGQAQDRRPPRAAGLPRRLAEHLAQDRRGADLDRPRSARLGARGHLHGGPPDPPEDRALGPALDERPGRLDRPPQAVRLAAGRRTRADRPDPDQEDPARRAHPPGQLAQARQRATPLPAPRLRLQRRLRRVRPAGLRLGVPGLLPRRAGAVRGTPSAR